MKWLKEVYSLFVDDPKLAVLALIALVVALVLVKLDQRSAAGLAIFLVVSGSLWCSTRHD